LEENGATILQNWKNMVPIYQTNGNRSQNTILFIFLSILKLFNPQKYSVKLGALFLHKPVQHFLNVSGIITRFH
jgi:hypothetical protein